MKLTKLARAMQLGMIHCQTSPDGEQGGGGAPLDLSTPDGIEAAVGDYIEESGLLDDIDFTTKPKKEEEGKADDDVSAETDDETSEGEDDVHEDRDEEGSDDDGDADAGDDDDGGDSTDQEPEWKEIKAKDDRDYPIDFEVKKTEAGPVYRFKAAGETVEASHPELIQGYQRMQDYSAKVNETMEKAAALDPYVNLVAAVQADPNFVEYVSAYLNGSPMQMPTRDQMVTEDQIRAALRDDPDEAERLMGKRTEQQEQLGKQHRMQQAQQAQQAEYLERQRVLVSQAIPDYDQVRSKLSDFLKSEGYSEQEVATVADARMVKVINKARMYDEMMAEKRAPQQELEGKRRKSTPPKVVKSGPGKQLPKAASKRSKDLMSKAQKTGQTDDWAAALTAAIPDDWV